MNKNNNPFKLIIFLCLNFSFNQKFSKKFSNNKNITGKKDKNIEKLTFVNNILKNHSINYFILNQKKLQRYNFVLNNLDKYFPKDFHRQDQNKLNNFFITDEKCLRFYMIIYLNFVMDQVHKQFKYSFDFEKIGHEEDEYINGLDINNEEKELLKTGLQIFQRDNFNGLLTEIQQKTVIEYYYDYEDGTYKYNKNKIKELMEKYKDNEYLIKKLEIMGNIMEFRIKMFDASQKEIYKNKVMDNIYNLKKKIFFDLLKKIFNESMDKEIPRNLLERIFFVIEDNYHYFIDESTIWRKKFDGFSMVSLSEFNINRRKNLLKYLTTIIINYNQKNL